MGEKKTNPVIIDDVTYNFEDLKLEEQQMVNHLVDLDRKLGGMQFNLSQLEVGKQAFLSLLRESLAKKDEVVQ
jgi:hypothetical protein